MKYIVYRTMNMKSDVDGQKKMYVGIHRVNNPDVFDGYLGDAVVASQASTFMYPKSPFQCDVKKYGVQSFRRETVCVCDTIEEAYAEESKLLTEGFVNEPIAYNMTVRVNKCPIYQFDLNGRFMKKWNTIDDACDFYGIPKERIDLAIDEKIIIGGNYWSVTKKIDIKEYGLIKSYNIIYLVNSKGKIIKLFGDLDKCAEWIGTDWKTVSEAVKWQWLVNNKYYVTNKVTSEFIPKPRRSFMKRTFYVYNEDGSFVGKFFGKELMKAINLHSWAKISKIFSMNNGWYKKFYISLEEVTEIPEKRRADISFDVYTLQGDFIETIKSIKEFKDKYQLTSAKVKNIQRGNKYCGNYIVKYNSK